MNAGAADLLLLMNLKNPVSESQAAEISDKDNETNETNETTTQINLKDLFHHSSDGKHENCAICGEGGTLILCDKNDCPLVYHDKCIRTAGLPTPIIDTFDSIWFCARCDGKSRLPLDAAIVSFEKLHKASKKKSSLLDSTSRKIDHTLKSESVSKSYEDEDGSKKRGRPRNEQKIVESSGNVSKSMTSMDTVLSSAAAEHGLKTEDAFENVSSKRPRKEVLKSKNVSTVIDTTVLSSAEHGTKTEDAFENVSTELPPKEVIELSKDVSTSTVLSSAEHGPRDAFENVSTRRTPKEVIKSSENVSTSTAILSQVTNGPSLLNVSNEEVGVSGRPSRRHKKCSHCSSIKTYCNWLYYDRTTNTVKQLSKVFFPSDAPDEIFCDKDLCKDYLTGLIL